jgi:hypothetical protein
LKKERKNLTFTVDMMLSRLAAGYRPVDVSIEKWKKIKEAWTKGVYDVDIVIDSTANCALCYTHYVRSYREGTHTKCNVCPIVESGAIFLR